MYVWMAYYCLMILHETYIKLKKKIDFDDGSWLNIQHTLQERVTW